MNIGETAADHEMGSETEPRRSFPGIAAFKQGSGAAAIVGSVMAALLSGLPVAAPPRRRLMPGD